LRWLNGTYRAIKEKWIKAKYVDRKFVTPAKSSKHCQRSFTRRLCESEETPNLVKLAELLAQGRSPFRSDFPTAKIDLNVQTGADIKWVDKENKNKSLTHFCVERGDNVSLQFLCLNGAKADVTDTDGQTPVHYAAKLAKPACMAVLLTLPSAKTTTKDSEGKTPFELVAAIKERTDAVLETLEALSKYDEKEREKSLELSGSTQAKLKKNRSATISGRPKVESKPSVTGLFSKRASQKKSNEQLEISAPLTSSPLRGRKKSFAAGDLSHRPSQLAFNASSGSTGTPPLSPRLAHPHAPAPASSSASAVASPCLDGSDKGVSFDDHVGVGDETLSGSSDSRLMERNRAASVGRFRPERPAPPPPPEDEGDNTEASDDDTASYASDISSARSSLSVLDEPSHSRVASVDSAPLVAAPDSTQVSEVCQVEYPAAEPAAIASADSTSDSDPAKSRETAVVMASTESNEANGRVGTPPRRKSAKDLISMFNKATTSSTETPHRKAPLPVRSASAISVKDAIYQQQQQQAGGQRAKVQFRRGTGTADSTDTTPAPK
jgi:hypothetical protein